MGFKIRQLFRRDRHKKSGKHTDPQPDTDKSNATVASPETNLSSVSAGANSAIEDRQNEPQPSSQDLWQTAFAKLNPDDQRKLVLLDTRDENSPDPQMADLVHTVIETTKKRYDEYQRKGLKIKRPKGEDINVRDSALKIVSATLSFQDIIGAAVGCDPTGYAGKVWGIISVGLTMIQNHQDLQASIFQASELLTDVLSRCAFIERQCLKSNSTNQETKDMLRNAIVRVYFAVLRYSSSVVSIQCSGAGRRFRLSAIALTDQPLTALKTAIGEEEKHLERWVQFDQQLLWKQRAEQTLAQIDNVLSGIQDISREMELCKLTIAEGAAFDSYTNQHEVECLPGTRTDLLKQVTDWSLSTQGECIFWLNGMAGTGKSTVSRTVCKLLQEQGLLGASFFFKRGKSDCGSAEKFFATIVRQIIVQEPRLIPSIRRAIQRDPSISTKSLGEQFNKLLLEPLLAVKHDPAGTSFLVVVVDALDECDPENDIGLLLRLLPMVSTQSSIRIRVFLTSRPEIPIREGFDNVSGDNHRTIGLHEIVESSIKHDILLFMNDRFEEMRRKLSLPKGWPGEKTIQDLVNMASPLFISAATMCRFIADRRWNPEKRLALVLGSGSTENASTSHISKLEHTYLPVFEQILHSGDDDEDDDEKAQLVQEYRVIVGTIIILANPLALTSLAKLLNVPSSDVSRRLDFLHSVLSIPDDEGTPIQLFHQSFRDFLLHPKVRTKTEFWIDEEHIHKETLFRCIEVMARQKGGLSKNICQLSSDAASRSDISDETIRDYLPAELQYSCHHWIYHLQRGKYQITDHDEIHKFVQKHFLHWLEAMSVLGLAQEIVSGIKTLQSAVQPPSGHIVSKFFYDANRFILKNSWVINNAPLQLYAAALAFAPTNSVVRNIFESELPRRFPKLPKVEEDWNAQLLTLDIKDVDTVVFSPDSRLIASATLGKPVKLWDSVTGLLLHTLDQVFYTSGMTFSPNGTHVACSSWDDTIQDHTVQLWDIDTGALYKSFTQLTSPVLSLAFSPDNKLLASASSDDTIYICDLTSDIVIRALEGHSHRVNTLAISPDGKLIASGSNDESVRIWELDTGALLQTFEHSGSVRSVGFSPNNELMASVPGDREIWIWDAGTGELQQKVGFDRIESSIFSPERILEATGFNRARLSDRILSTLFHRFDVSSRDSWKLAVSPNSDLLVSCSDDGRVQLCDTRIAATNSTIQAHSHEVTAIQLSPDSKFLGSVSSDHKVLLWDATTGLLLHTLNDYSGKSGTFSFSPDSKLVAFRPQSNSTCIQLWNVETGQLHRTLEDHLDSVDRVMFSPNCRQLASIEEHGAITLWDIQTGGRMYSLESRGSWVCVAFSQTGAKLATGSHDAVRVWDASTGVLQQELKGHKTRVTAVAFSPDERLIASGSNDAKLCFWDLAKGDLCQTLQDSGAISQVAFSTDGRLVASGTLSQTFRLWDRETGNSIFTSNYHACHYRAGIANLRFSSDNTYLEADFGKLRIPSDEATDSSPNQGRNVILGEQWLHIGDKRVLWLPVEYRPKVSAYYNGTFAIGGGTGLVSFISVDLSGEANGHS
ncbi:WD40-repeat-containing domain protein [Aspergillus pseudotamarii]|uniref:WD40-repeat-containing domain protein n=1 Tax=Aspergillus pseudotamarii TaxID=132259 RepID=A0A5N6SLC7_ASPPS|nr:WD40-repeat-containing domain protein [Aspergillus pseudotamarii]KAE8135482.1 WD40-repeat-containing domain protein [Aspergillus pseudotamarii]